MGNLVKNGISYTGGSGASSYNELNDKPSINGTTLSGNKTPEALGLVTKAVDDLVNYYKKTETYTKGEIDTIVTAIKNSRFEAVATLPTSDIKTNVIYLVPKAESESGDIKDEYINLDGTTAGWEKIGSTDIDLSGYVTTVALNTVLANYTTTTDLTALLAGKQDKMQYSTLPAPSAELEGKIFEYIGATGGGLTHGYFYECVSDGEDPASYSWVQTNVQPSGGGGGSYTAGDGIDITEDVISTEKSQEGDIDEIIDVYPQAGNLVSIVNAFNRGDIYSIDEKMIGQWIDGKPLYQKTISTTMPSTIPVNQKTDFYDASALNAEHFELIEGHIINSDNDYIPLLGYGQYMIIYYASNKLGVYGSLSWAASRPVIFTIQYTKTTDTAISIGSETEYSTDEKVVGTWLDGKPIYQKTVNFGALPNTALKEVNHNISDIENIISYTGVAIDAGTSLMVGYCGNYINHLSDIGIVVNTSKISIITYNDRSAYKNTYITIQYTKTT